MLTPAVPPLVQGFFPTETLILDGTSPSAAAAWSNSTLVVRIPRSGTYGIDGQRMRILLDAPGNPVASTTIASAYVMDSALSGDAFDFRTTPIQITFGGQNSITFSADIWSDVIDLSEVEPQGAAWLFAFNITTMTRVEFYNNSPAGSGLATYRRGAVQHAATVNKASFTAAGTRAVYLIREIEAV